MHVKSERELFRRRRRFPWFRTLLILGVLGAAATYGYRALRDFVEPFTPSAAPTPQPTPTPSAAVYVSAGEDAYFRGAVFEAIAAYEQALDMEPNQTDLYLELARLLTYYGQPERGLEMARQAVLRQPESARAWAILGMTYDWLGLPQRAIAYCERAVELDPTLPEAYAFLAEAYIDAGQWYAANETIARAAELAPDNVDVLRNQAYVLENQGNYSGAIAGYREALARHETQVHLYLAIGRNAGALGNLTVARNAYADAVEIDPFNVVALDQLGWSHLLLGDYDSARQYLVEALDLDPDAIDVYGHLGTLYFHQRNYEDALDMFGPALTYGEARSRRRTVLFSITTEDANGVGGAPEGREVAVAAFVHPSAIESPLRGEFRAADGTTGVRGMIRFDPVSGRYQLNAGGVPPAPSGKVYVGWFLPLYTPEGWVVRTDPIFPAPDGNAQLSGSTGVVKGPPIEYYYSTALSHYLLDQCDEALPAIEIALRIDPEDENALQTRELCR